MRREGDRLIIELAAPRSLLSVLAGLEPLEETFPAIDALRPIRRFVMAYLLGRTSSPILSAIRKERQSSTSAASGKRTYARASSRRRSCVSALRRKVRSGCLVSSRLCSARSKSCRSKSPPTPCMGRFAPARKGRPTIGGADLLIAAHALALGLTLVTDNELEFARVEGLKWENWLRR